MLHGHGRGRLKNATGDRWHAYQFRFAYSNQAAATTMAQLSCTNYSRLCACATQELNCVFQPVIAPENFCAYRKAWNPKNTKI